MISVSLLDFARTGAFGPIELGMTRAKLQDLLGLPESWGTERARARATIWRYADIEFYFHPNELDMIFTDHDALARGGSTCIIEPWVIRSGLRAADFLAVLQAEKIKFAVVTPDWDPRRREIFTAAGVQYSFIEEPDPEWPEDPLGLFAWCKAPTMSMMPGKFAD